MSAVDERRLTSVQEHLNAIPHARALGLTLMAVGDNSVQIRLPYDAKLVGDPDTGVIHGGAITALLDNAAGIAARPQGMDRRVTGIATLDLRIDYMGPATPGLDVVGRAVCFKRGSTIAFVRAEAYHDDPDDPIATCTAAFMIGTPNAPRPAVDQTGNGSPEPGGGDARPATGGRP